MNRVVSEKSIVRESGCKRRSRRHGEQTSKVTMERLAEGMEQQAGTEIMVVIWQSAETDGVPEG